jgi:hypothetical protein
MPKNIRTSSTVWVGNASDSVLGVDVLDTGGAAGVDPCADLCRAHLHTSRSSPTCLRRRMWTSAVSQPGADRPDRRTLPRLRGDAHPHRPWSHPHHPQCGRYQAPRPATASSCGPAGPQLDQDDYRPESATTGDEPSVPTVLSHSEPHDVANARGHTHTTRHVDNSKISRRPFVRACQPKAGAPFGSDRPRTPSARTQPPVNADARKSLGSRLRHGNGPVSVALHVFHDTTRTGTRES